MCCAFGVRIFKWHLYQDTHRGARAVGWAHTLHGTLERIKEAIKMIVTVGSDGRTPEYCYPITFKWIEQLKLIWCKGNGSRSPCLLTNKIESYKNKLFYLSTPSSLFQLISFRLVYHINWIRNYLLKCLPFKAKNSWVSKLKMHYPFFIHNNLSLVRQVRACWLLIHRKIIC